MNWEWISEKGTSLVAGSAGLFFLAVALLDRRYRYFFLCAAAVAFFYAHKRFKKRPPQQNLWVDSGSGRFPSV